MQEKENHFSDRTLGHQFKNWWQQDVTGMLHCYRFESTIYSPLNQNPDLTVWVLVWWGMVDSNHRRHSQQIYSLSPLAAREISHIKMELVDGLEPPTCWLQISCSTDWATPAFLQRPIIIPQNHKCVKWFLKVFLYYNSKKSSHAKKVSDLLIFYLISSSAMYIFFFKTYIFVHIDLTCLPLMI